MNDPLNERYHNLEVVTLASAADGRSPEMVRREKRSGLWFATTE